MLPGRPAEASETAHAIPMKTAAYDDVFKGAAQAIGQVDD
jgi:hypothetical protein